jgi:ubiquinone biosynthesis protein
MERLPRMLAKARDEAATPLSAKDVERILKGAWHAAPSKVLDELDAEPLAVTAVAQLHRARRDGEAVAVKVRRPGLAATVRSDLALLDALSAPLRQVFGATDTGAILREVRATVMDELDFEHEASTQRQVRRALRGVDGVVVPAPDLELSTEDVMVAELLEGPTLADAESADPAQTVRAIAGAHAAAARAGLALPDAKPNHIILLDDGAIGLLATGMARPLDKARTAAALDALEAFRAGDADGFAATLATELKVLPDDAAREAYTLLEAIAGDLLRGPATLDEPALAAAAERALDRLDDALPLAATARPQAADLAPARAVGQLATLLARLGAHEDWGALLAAARPAR